MQTSTPVKSSSVRSMTLVPFFSSVLSLYCSLLARRGRNNHFLRISLHPAASWITYPGNVMSNDFASFWYRPFQSWWRTSPFADIDFTNCGLWFTNSPVAVVHSFPRPPTHRWSPFTQLHSHLKPSVIVLIIG